MVSLWKNNNNIHSTEIKIFSIVASFGESEFPTLMINVLSRVFPSSTAQSYLIFSVNISGVILTTASNPLYTCTVPVHIHKFIFLFVFFYYFVVITNIIIANNVITNGIYLLLLLLLSFWLVVLSLAFYHSVQFLFLFFTQISVVCGSFIIN